MNERRRVSVIVPAYNRAHTIERAIQSVLNQTFQDYEILIVNDGSTDETEDIVKRYEGPRIRLLRHEINRGPSAARNTGIRAAAGEYVAFLDSDDEWLSEKLNEQVNALQSSPPAIRASCTGLYLELMDSHSVVEKIPHWPASWSEHLLMGCDLSPGTTLVATKASFEEVGPFDEALHRFEDWDWLLRYVNEYDLTLVQKPLAKVYRTLHKCARKVEDSALQFMAKHHEDFKAYDTFCRRKARARLWLVVSDAFFREGIIGKGAYYFMKALLENPVQRLGLYLQVIDGMLGTTLAPRASRIRASLLRHK